MSVAGSSAWMGPQTTSNSLPVTIATDQPPIPVQLTATPVIDIGMVDQGMAAAVSDGWPVKITDGVDVLGTASHPLYIYSSGSTAVVGSVAITNFPATQPVSGSVAVTNFPGTSTVAVSGTPVVTVSGTPVVTVSGSVAVSSIAGSVAISSVAGSVAISTVAGSVTVLQGSSPWITSTTGSVSILNFPATQNVNVTGLPNFFGTATYIAPSSAAVSTTMGQETLIINVSGTWTGSFVLEGSIDAGVTYPISIPSTSYIQTGTLPTGNGTFTIPVGGYSNVRLRAVTLSSGSAVALFGTTSGVNVVQALQASSPWVVSGSVTALQGAAPWSENVTQFGGVNISTGTGASGTGIPRVTVSNDSTVNGPTLTKGTQGATGFSVQDLKDSGRTQVNYYATAAASGTTTTETSITLTKSSGTGSTSTGTSFVVTSGKRYRIVGIACATRGNSTATAQATTFNLRVNTGGVVAVNSTPVLLALRCATPATALAYDRYFLPVPDGFEILGDGTLQFGMTAAATFVTNAPTWDVTIVGFEY